MEAALQQRPAVRRVVAVLDAPRVDRRSPSYCRVTFDHPPINTITATTVAELAELVGLIEQDPDLNVVVFDSANPDFYLAHYDTEHDPGKTVALAPARPACTPWLDLLGPAVARPGRQHRVDPRARPRRRQRVRPRLRPPVRLARERDARPVRGRTGVVPGGGPMARLARLVGRGRALEILLVADDIDGRARRALRLRQPRRRRRRARREVDRRSRVAARALRPARPSRRRSPTSTATLPARRASCPAALADFFALVRAPPTAGAPGRSASTGSGSTRRRPRAPRSASASSSRPAPGG